MRLNPCFPTLLFLSLSLGNQSLALDAGAPASVQSCATITNAEERLRCYDRLTSDTNRQPPPAIETSEEWRILHTRTPEGDSISAMRTADTARSDPDFAGLSIHCGRDGPEILLIVIQPFPPKAKPQVLLGGPINEARFQASVLPSGAALLLPKEVMALAIGPWQSQVDLPVTIENEETKIRGVIPLKGFSTALKTIAASCSPKNSP